MQKAAGRRVRERAAVLGLAAALVVACWAGAASATSGGPDNSGPSNSAGLQGCPTNDDAWSYHGAYPGCHSVNVVVQDGSGRTYAEAGTDQTGQGENLHSGTVMVTPNGDGNPYGDPQGTPPCPDVAQNSTPPQPGQQEADQSCQTDQPASAVNGPGAGASFDTGYEPLPPSDCGLESALLSPLQWAAYVAGSSSEAPCTVAPLAWNGPTTPVADDPSQDGQSFDPAADLPSAPSWAGSIQAAWNLPGGPPSLSPWTSSGPLDASCASSGPVSGPCALALLSGFQLSGVGDDNVNTGEHDGMDGQYSSANTFDGSPDGGGTYVDWQPGAGISDLEGWPAIFEAAASSGSVAPLASVLEDPMPLLTAGFGAGFDGPYAGVYTNRQTLYHGGGGSDTSSSVSRDIYDYQEPNGHPKDWQPAACANGSAAGEQACLTNPGSNGQTPQCQDGGGPNDPTCGANYYQQQEASNDTTEPGVMIYNNPDPQSSGSNGTPGAYVGTCGAVLPTGAFGFPSEGLGPLGYTNSAGQFVAADPTGC